jgi:PII-like signaling protein
VSQPGIKLTTYFSERDRSGDRFLADALFDVYERHRMRTSVLLRGVEGFGQHGHLQSDHLLTLSENLPAVSIAVDTRERVERALPDVLRVAGHGLISLERAQLAAGREEIARLELPDDSSHAIKLTVYGGRSVRSGGQSGYVAAVDLLRRRNAAGASALLAVDGTLHGARRRARFFARNAGVPLMLLTIGDRATIGSLLSDLAALVDDPVATVERVQICKTGGRTLSEPHTVPERDDLGLPIWQKLMIHAEEQAKVGAHPLYRELILRLKEAGAAGATALRGVRGFYGDHEPFADRLLALRRNVPVHVIVVDRPPNVRRWWPIVDEATREAGLVTSELVPASHAFSGVGSDPALELAATPTSAPPAPASAGPQGLAPGGAGAVEKRAG